jgi:hypothetical protein
MSIQKQINANPFAQPVTICLGRAVILEEFFEPNGTFKAFRNAEARLKELGYTVGSMCRDEPIGFAHESTCDYIAKWRNLDQEDISKLDGVMLSEDFRDGGVRIVFFNPVPNQL